MGMSNHTPGPWAVNADNVSAGPEDGFQPFSACGCCNSPWMNGKDEDVQLANARLIAAAPDLIFALQELVEYLGEGDEGPGGVLTHRLTQARAAIAKATGEK